MGRDQKVQVRFSKSELELITLAAEQTSLDLPSFLRHAALALAGDIKPQQYGQYELNTIYREANSRGYIWPEEELRERQLPLYWSEAWVRARLAEGKSINQLAILTGSPQTTVQNHLRMHFNIRAYQQLTEERIELIRTRYLAGESRRAIATDMGISNVTVGKYLKDLPTDLERVAQAMLAEQEQTPEHRQDVVPPNIQGLQDRAERLFAERARLLSWPNSTQKIAEVLFEGRNSAAKDWTDRMVAKGRLVRLARGWFDLGSSLPSLE